MTWAAITGWGMAVPERVVTNDDLARAFAGIDAAWIEQRTGILQRRHADAGETTSTLASTAGRMALARAGLHPDALDLIVVATCTPDRPIPATAPTVQDALGARNAGAFDINSACAGFLTALGAAGALIQNGSARRALVVGAEVLSRFLDWDDPKTCVLFGDGAGAVVLERSETPAGLLSFELGADGSGRDLIHTPAGGSARPASWSTVEAREHTIRMDGREVYRAAVRVMSDGVARASRPQGSRAAGADLVIVHQANQRIIDEVATRLNVPPERMFSNVARYGNTSAASIPIALCEAADRGLLSSGDRVVLSAIGAGLSWASGCLLWTAERVPVDGHTRTREEALA